MVFKERNWRCHLIIEHNHLTMRHRLLLPSTRMKGTGYDTKEGYCTSSLTFVVHDVCLHLLLPKPSCKKLATLRKNNRTVRNALLFSPSHLFPSTWREDNDHVQNAKKQVTMPVTIFARTLSSSHWSCMMRQWGGQSRWLCSNTFLQSSLAENMAFPICENLR